MVGAVECSSMLAECKSVNASWRPPESAMFGTIILTKSEVKNVKVILMVALEERSLCQ